MLRSIRGFMLFGAGLASGLLVMRTVQAQDDRLTGIRINHVGIFARNWDESIQFYTKTLGFKEAFTFKDKDGNVTTSYTQIPT